jgi:hypothetical protein
VSVQTGAIALVSLLMLFLFFSEVGGRLVAIYLLALTTLITLMTSMTLVTSAMPISLRLYYQHGMDQ